MNATRDRARCRARHCPPVRCLLLLALVCAIPAAVRPTDVRAASSPSQPQRLPIPSCRPCAKNSIARNRS